LRPLSAFEMCQTTPTHKSGSKNSQKAAQVPRRLLWCVLELQNSPKLLFVACKVIAENHTRPSSRCHKWLYKVPAVCLAVRAHGAMTLVGWDTDIAQSSSCVETNSCKSMQLRMRFCSAELQLFVFHATLRMNGARDIGQKTL
jgi:hypothetical protein